MLALIILMCLTVFVTGFLIGFKYGNWEATRQIQARLKQQWLSMHAVSDRLRKEIAKQETANALRRR